MNLKHIILLFFIITNSFFYSQSFEKNGVHLKRGTLTVRKAESEIGIARDTVWNSAISQSPVIAPFQMIQTPIDPNEMKLGGDWRMRQDKIKENKYFSRIKFLKNGVYLYDEFDKIIDSGVFISYKDKDKKDEQYESSKDGYSGGTNYGFLNIKTSKVELESIEIEVIEKAYLGRRPEYMLTLKFPENKKVKHILYPYGKEFLFGNWSKTTKEDSQDNPHDRIKILGDSIYFISQGEIVDKGKYFATKEETEQYILGVQPYSGYNQMGKISFNLSSSIINNINYELEEKKNMGESVQYKLKLFFNEDSKPIEYEL